MNLLDQVKASAAKLKDQTADTGGSFERELPAAGKALARFVSYIEIGKRPQKPYMGKAKPDAHEVLLSFELLGKKHRKEIKQDNETKVVYPVIHIRTTIKGGERAGFTKLLKSMAYGRDITHMALMLGEGFVVDVVHNKVGEGQDAKTYANLRNDTGWTVSGPFRVDDEGETAPLNVPAATQPLKLLLWDAPTKEQWESIFIDGTYEKKDDKGNVTQVSKNWIQENILKATDFEGSAVQALLLELAGGSLGDTLEGTVETPSEKSVPDTRKAEKPAPSSADAAGDPLADLGFSDL